MATIHLPNDFKEFLQLLNNHGVKYLLVGGYAVVIYGYPRATGDLDVWVASDAENQRKLASAFSDFGFNIPPSSDPFLTEGQFIGMGTPPLRIEILTRISGVQFEDCYPARNVESVDGIEINIIRISDLKKNKGSTGRLKDQVDLKNLPG